MNGVLLLCDADGRGGIDWAIHAEEKPRAPPVTGQVCGVERKGRIEFLQRGIETLEPRFALGELAESGCLPPQVIERFGGATALHFS